MVVAQASGLRIIPAFFLLSWLLKYAYSVLDDAANGLSAPPVPSVDMLGPFEPRPLIQLFLCAAVYKTASLIGGASGNVVLLTYLALLPASIGVLAVTEDVISALNPLTLVRTAWALGWYYLLILGFIVCYAGALWSLRRTPMWEIAWYAMIGLAVLSLFGLIGGVIFVRRAQLAFEPRSSPERTAATAEADRLKRRSRVLDETYALIRVNEYRRAVDPIRQWLLGQSAEDVALDVSAIMTQAAQWNSRGALAAISQCVDSYLIHIDQLGLALETFTVTVGKLPDYALDSEEDTVVLSRHAKAMGNSQLANTIVKNFVARRPSSRASIAAKTLIRDLDD